MPDKPIIDQILGRSAWAVETRKRVEQIARHRYNVTITGAPGTGKRFLAGILHQLSPRCDKPMVPIDCGQLGEATFASQLFGHEAGAVPGATGAALGCFRAADGGTLYLGHVEALPLELQPPLFDALKTRSIVPLGAAAPVSVDVRIIASSEEDLQRAVQQRRLMSELYTLLDAVSMRTIPLAQRREDIGPLSDHFLQLVAEEFDEAPKRLGRDALVRLQAYDWPGNLAELEDAIQRAAVFSEDEILSASAFTFLAG